MLGAIYIYDWVAASEETIDDWLTEFSRVTE